VGLVELVGHVDTLVGLVQLVGHVDTLVGLVQLVGHVDTPGPAQPSRSRGGGTCREGFTESRIHDTKGNAPGSSQRQTREGR
jgi:hypothetical protein